MKMLFLLETVKLIYIYICVCLRKMLDTRLAAEKARLQLWFELFMNHRLLFHEAPGDRSTFPSEPFTRTDLVFSR